jgi:uncharacterized protein with HEPN domain
VRDYLKHIQDEIAIPSYFGIDYDIVWDVLINHIPALAGTIDAMLEGQDMPATMG